MTTYPMGTGASSNYWATAMAFALAGAAHLSGCQGCDFDDDGVLVDNCPLTSNPDQENSDANEFPLTAPDLFGDACDSCPHDEQEVYGAVCETGRPTYEPFAYADMMGDGCGCEEQNPLDANSPFVDGGSVKLEQPLPAPEPTEFGHCFWDMSFAIEPGDDCVVSGGGVAPFRFTVHEVTCSWDGLLARDVECEYGCAGGGDACACAEADTDGGNDPFNFGDLPTGERDRCLRWNDVDGDAVIDRVGDGLVPTPVGTTCYNDDPEAPEGTQCVLEEWILEPAGDLCEPRSLYHTCVERSDLGCRAGACLCADGDDGNPYEGSGNDDCDGTTLTEHTRGLEDDRCVDRFQEFECAVQCADGQCACDDSDGGDNPFVAGESGAGDPETCDDGNTVLEYAPGSDFGDHCFEPIEVDCPAGIVCEDGACQPPDGAPDFRIACVPVLFNPLLPSSRIHGDSADLFDHFCTEEFNRFVRTSGVGSHARAILDITHWQYDPVGALVPAVELFDHARDLAGPDPNLVMGVTPDADSLALAVVIGPGTLGRAFPGDGSAFVALSTITKYHAVHELAHLITRRVGGVDQFVCEEYDFDPWFDLEVSGHCVNDFPLEGDSGGDEDCVAVADGEVDADNLCNGHDIEVLVNGEVLHVRDIMSFTSEDVRQEFDPQVLAHFAAYFDEL